MPKRTKQLISRSYASRFETVSEAVLIDCARLTAEQAVQFRATLREAGAAVTVVKNSLADQVFKDRGIEMPESAFAGPTAVVYGEVDAITASKAISEWSKKNGNKVRIKAGLLEGAALDETEAQGLTQMPSLPELKQMIVNVIAAPLVGVVGVTSSILAGVPGVLQAIADKKKEEEGE